MPDRKQDRTGSRPEFEVAYYTKELGQPLQRQMLRKQLARFIGSGRDDGTGGQDAATPADAAPPEQGSTS